MTSPAGRLTVTSPNGAVGTDSFTVNINRNLTITNYRGREMGEPGDIKASIYDGNGYTEKIYKNGKKSDQLSTMDLRRARYDIMNSIRSLDGNSDDLTEKDISLVGQLDKKALGITNIRRDANAGVTTIECKDGAVLRFDFETDAEMQVRKTKEAADAQKAKEARAKAKAQSDQKKEAFQRELNEACKSDLEKFLEKAARFASELFGL